MRVNSSITAALLVVLAACGAASGQARAEATANVALANFHYRLVDLAPDDGIAPSIDLTSYYGYVFGTLYNEDTISGYAGINTFGTANYDSTDGFGHFKIQYDATNIDLDTLVGSASAQSGHTLLFTLSPYTEVIFDMDGSLAASAGPGEDAGASATLFSGIFETPGSEDYASLTSGSEHVALSVSTSSGADWAQGSAGFIAVAAANVYVPPVPEPAPAAMLTGGLALIAGLLRRGARARPRSRTALSAPLPSCCRYPFRPRAAP